MKISENYCFGSHETVDYCWYYVYFSITRTNREITLDLKNVTTLEMRLPKSRYRSSKISVASKEFVDTKLTGISVKNATLRDALNSLLKRRM